MTRQEMFERAVTGLRSQGFNRCGIADAAFSTGMRCQYSMTSDDGSTMHCAAGWLITDITIRPEHNAVSIGELVEIYADVRSRFWDNASFIVDMQNAHDGAADPYSMVQRLRTTGLKYELDVSCLDGVVP